MKSPVSTRLRVAHLTTVDSSLLYLLLPQLRAVTEQGGEVVGISAPGRFVEVLERTGVRHIPLEASTRGMNLAADLRAALQLWRILRRERFDVLHTHNPKPGVYGRIVGRLAGVPIVVNTVHGLYATSADPLPKRMAVYLLEALASRFSHAELIQSSEDLSTLWRWRLVPRRALRYLGNGIDLTRFDPKRFSERRRLEIRRDLGVGESQIVVGSVGRLVAEKGYPELLQAMGRLGDRYVLLIVGPEDPDKADGLSREAIEEAKATGVRFLGMREDVDALYAAMDIFVLASHREGVPRAAMEAAAMGLPIVATDVRGCREVVEDGVSGSLVPVNDLWALARAIAELGEDAGLRGKLGDAGARRAKALFDERRVVQTVMRTYQDVARRNGRRGLRR